MSFKKRNLPLLLILISNLGFGHYKLPETSDAELSALPEHGAFKYTPTNVSEAEAFNIPNPNNPPVANTNHFNVLEDVMREIILTASDSDGNPLTYSIVVSPLHGTLNGFGTNYTYTPASNYYGSDSFKFMVNDGTTNSNLATVTITVIAVNDPPEADDQSVSTDEAVAVPITLTASDVDGGILFFVLENQPAHGTLTGLAPNLTYTPNPGYSGMDSFSFVANDGENSCYQSATSPPATVSITVNDVLHPPTVNDRTITTDEDIPKNITLSGNDFDGDGLSFSIVSSPTHGMLTGILPNITYTPNENYYGEDSFSYFANDGSLDSNVGLISITINAVNDPPVATSRNLTGTEDLPLSILLSASDPESDALTFVIVTPPTHGTLSGSGASIQYTPFSNYNGPDSFTFKASDVKTNSNLATIEITLAPVNDAPIANAQTILVTEDIEKAITLSANDVDGNTLAYTIINTPSYGILTGTAPNLTYKPGLNYNGLDSFSFEVNDGITTSNAVVSITVNPVNDPPVADAQNVLVIEDTEKSITISGNDVEGNSLSYTILNSPSNGTLTGTGPNIKYMPGLNYNGLDSFSFQISDGLTTSTAVVSIIVDPVNDPPIADSQNVFALEDTEKSFTLTGNDVDGNSSTFTILNSPSHGTLTGTAPNVKYMPGLNYNGLDSFNFQISDGLMTSTAVVSITVDPVNDIPVATNQNLSGTEDTPLSILLAASDEDGDILSYTIETPPAHGTLSGSGSTINYTPFLNYNGSDSFTFKASDASASSAVATVGIVLSPVNDPPIANAQDLLVIEDIEKSVTLTGTDIDGNTLIYTIINAPSKGILTGTAPDLTYKPGLNYNGLDSFSFEVNDGLATSTAVVSISVAPVNDSPTVTLFGAPIEELSFSTLEDVLLSFCFDAIDIDGDIPQIKSFNQITASGRLSIKPDGTANNYCLNFDPTLNYNGQTIWSLNVCDPGNACAQVKIKVSIIPVNDPPIAVNDNFEVEAGITTVLDALSNDLVIADSYQEFYDLFLERDSIDQLRLIKVKAFNGSASIEDNKIQYMPKFGFHGKDSIQYWIQDSGGLKDSATVFLDLSPAKFRAFEAVSPNGDELNDYWHINGIEQDPDNNVRVFDRYNNLVFETVNYDNERNQWYGQANNGLNNGTLPDGTYYYTISIDLKEDDEGRRLFSGYLVLKRN